MSSIKKNVGLEISHHLYLFSVKMYDWLKEKFGSMVRKLINTIVHRCFHCQMKLKPVILSSKHFVLFSKKRDVFFNTKLNDRCLKSWNTHFWYPGSYHQASAVAAPCIRVNSLLFLAFKTILSLWQTTNLCVRLGFGSWHHH